MSYCRNILSDFYKDTILYKETLSYISTIIDSGDSLTLSWMPDGGRTFIAHSFLDQNFLKQKKSKHTDSHIFIYIDQSIGIIYINEHILASISIYGNFTDVKTGLFSLLKSGKRIVFLIDNFKYDDDFFLYLNSLRSLSIDRISFIFFVLQSELQYLEQNYQNASSLIFHNVKSIGYLERKEAFDWLKMRSNELGISMSLDTILRAARFSGGVPSLLDACIRYIDKYKRFSKAIKSPEMKVIVSKLWSRFSNEEKKYLQKSFFGTLTEEDKKLAVVANLRYFRVIDTYYAVVGEWIAYALETRSELKIEARDDRLIIDSVDYSDTFNDSEKEFLILLLSYNKIIYKDEVGEILYPDGDYTSWAIDKFISRLRKKVKKIGLSDNLIATVRGKGYKAGNIAQMKRENL